VCNGDLADDDKIYVAVSDTKFTAVPPGTPGAQESPFDSKVAWLLDRNTGGGIHALRLESGKEVWHTPHPGCSDVPGCGPAQSAAVTAIPGIVFSGGLDGHLRAYSADDGRMCGMWIPRASTAPSTVLPHTAVQWTDQVQSWSAVCSMSIPGTVSGAARREMPCWPTR
jgi:hypothetical protein